MWRPTIGDGSFGMYVWESVVGRSWCEEVPQRKSFLMFILKYLFIFKCLYSFLILSE